MDLNSNDALSFKKILDSEIENKIETIGVPKYISAVVSSIRSDKKINVYLPPNSSDIITGLLNKTGEVLHAGDSVEIATKNGKLKNAWVAVKHGSNNSGQYIDGDLTVAGAMNVNGNTTLNGALNVNGNFYTADRETKNTVDTWVPVWNGGKLEHRVIPIDYNNAPSTLNVGGATNLNGGVLRANGMFLYHLDGMNAQGRFYRIANIPATSNENAIQLNIRGSLGNWTTNKATIDLQISNRNGLYVYGTFYGVPAALDNNQRIVIYQEANGSHTVYLYNVSAYTGGNTFEITWSGFTVVPTIYTDYSYITAPSGTNVWNGTNSKLTNIGDSYYGVGERITLGGTTNDTQRIFNGMITSSTTTVYVDVTTPKRLDNISTVQCVDCNVEARGGKGYLNSESGYHQYLNRSGYTLQAYKASPNTITLKIIKSSAWSNVDNNTLISLSGLIVFTVS